MASAEHYEYDFSNGDAGASKTMPCVANNMHQGGHVLLDGKPCKITIISKAKPGKHGHAKIMVTGTDIFTGKNYDGVSPATHNMLVPIVSRRNYLPLNITAEGYLVLFDNSIGDEKIDVKMPQGVLGVRIEKKFKDADTDVFVTVLSAMGMEIAVDVVEKDLEA
jgi:translation initiation factor 5A